MRVTVEDLNSNIAFGPYLGLSHVFAVTYTTMLSPSIRETQVQFSSTLALYKINQGA